MKPMMNCSDDSLRLLLREDEHSSDYREAARHVDSCPHCQQRIGELAAEDYEWHEAHEMLLAGDESGTGTIDQLSAHERSRGRWQRQPTAWTEAMARQLLSPPSHPEMLGRIGRYEVERLIGTGGMGVVFKAFDSELNRPVAVKLLTPYLAGNGAARKRFAREARAAAAVVHEHVVSIHNVETDGEVPFLVMQYVPGESLQSRLDREGPLDLCEILRIGMQTASGLAAAHAQGLVHRDVKPSNVLLEKGVERSLLTDFGLARASDDASLTRTGHHPGTPQYMSPEQARGDAVDARSDLFSLGSVMYAMCTGRPPFRAETSYGVLRRITDAEPRPIREINPNIPEWLERLIQKLLAKSLVNRFQTADEVAELLRQCLAHVQQPTSVPLPASLVPHATVRRSIFTSTRLGVLAMLGTIGMTLLGMVLWQQMPEGPDVARQSQVAPQPAFSHVTMTEKSATVVGMGGDNQEFVLRIAKSKRNKQHEWTAQANGQFTVTVTASDQLPSDNGKMIKGIVLTVQNPTSTSIANIAMSEGDPVPAGTVRFRQVSTIDRADTMMTIADILCDDGTTIPVSIFLRDKVDRSNARTVVEAYVAAALVDDTQTAALLAKDAPAESRQIESLPKQLNVQRLVIKSVYVNDPARPTTALATSEAVKLTKKQPDGQRDGFLVLTLTMSEEDWWVTDIDFESEDGAEDELKRFREANPGSIDLPPLTRNSSPQQNTVVGNDDSSGYGTQEIATALDKLANDKAGAAKRAEPENTSDPRVPDANGIYWSDRNEDQWVAGMKVVTWPNALYPKMVVEFVLRNDSSEAREIDVDVKKGSIASLTITKGNEAAVDFKERYREKRKAEPGEVLTFEQGRRDISFAWQPSGDYTLRFDETGAFVLRDKRAEGKGRAVPFALSLRVPFEDSVENLPIRWSEPRGGLRLGAMFVGAKKGETPRFRQGDQAAIQLFVQNMTKQEVNFTFEPHDVDGAWIVGITDRAGVKMEPASEALGVLKGEFNPSELYVSKLAPGEIQPITGELPTFRDGRIIPGSTQHVDYACFNIRATKPKDIRGQAPLDYVLPVGRYSAAISVTLLKPGTPDAKYGVECSGLEFEVVEGGNQAVLGKPHLPVPDANGIYWSDRNKDHWVTGMKVVQWPNAVNPTLVVEFLLRNDLPKPRDVDATVPGGNKTSLSLSEGNKATVDFKERRREKLTAAANGILAFKEGRAEISFAGLEAGEYTLRFQSVMAIQLADDELPHGVLRHGVPFDLSLLVNFDRSYASLPIHWGQPVAGLRLGAMFLVAPKDQAKRFQLRDHALAQLFVRNMSQQEVECGFDPPYYPDGWGMNISDRGGHRIDADRDLASDGIRIGPPILIPHPTRWALLNPGEIQPITGDLPKFRARDKDEGSEPYHPHAQFMIVPVKPAQHRAVPPFDYILPTGEYTVRLSAILRKADSPDATFEVKSSPIPFQVGDVQGTANLMGAEKVPEVEAALDRKDARAVVEAYVAAALASDIAKAAALAENIEADPKRIAEMPNLFNVRRLTIETVYVDDPARPSKALATSESVRLTKKQPDGQRDGFLVLTLTMSDKGWLVTDIDFESEEGAEDELKRFRDANPMSTDLPLLGPEKVLGTDNTSQKDKDTNSPRPLSGDTAAKLNSSSEAGARFDGRDLDQWLKMLREEPFPKSLPTGSKSQSNQASDAPFLAALNAIRILREDESCGEAIEKELHYWIKQLSRERKEARLTWMAQIVLRLAGEKHTEEALDAIYKSVSALPVYQSFEVVEGASKKEPPYSAFVATVRHGLSESNRVRVNRRWISELMNGDSRSRAFTLAMIENKPRSSGEEPVDRSPYAAYFHANRDNGIEAFLAATRDTDKRVAIHALTLLESLEWHDPRLFERLIEGFNDPDEDFAHSCLWSLKDWEPAREQLLAKLEAWSLSKVPSLEWRAVRTYYTMAKENGLSMGTDRILALLENPDWGEQSPPVALSEIMPRVQAIEAFREGIPVDARIWARLQAEKDHRLPLVREAAEMALKFITYEGRAPGSIDEATKAVSR